MVKREVYIEIGRVKGTTRLVETPVLYITSKREIKRMLKKVKQKLREVV